MECCAQKFVRLRKIFRIGENLSGAKRCARGQKKFDIQKKNSSKISVTMSQKNVALDVRRGGKLKIHPGVRHPSYATYCR